MQHCIKSVENRSQIDDHLVSGLPGTILGGGLREERRKRKLSNEIVLLLAEEGVENPESRKCHHWDLLKTVSGRDVEQT